MSKNALALLMAICLASGAGASILPITKGKRSTGQNISFIKKRNLVKGSGHSIILSANQLYIVADSLKNKRITAAILAVPLGFLGVHRMYLGTKPHIPIIYIATIGGCFGILPFIDFVVLLLTDDLTPFINNSRVFMWNKPKKDN